MIGDERAELKQAEGCSEAEDAENEAEAAGAADQLVERGQQDAEDETGEMRQRRVLEGLQPGTPAPAIGGSNAVRVEDDVEDSWDHA